MAESPGRGRGAGTDLLLFTLAFVLRAALAARTELWFDEIHSIAMAELPLGDLLLPSTLKGFGPLYFVLLKVWMLLGHGDLWLRLPSISCDALTAVLLRRTVARDFSPSAAVLAGLLYAISPWNVFSGAQVRMHPFGPPLLLTWLLCDGALPRALSAMALALAIPTIAPFLLVLGFSSRARLRDRWALAGAITVCFFFAWSGIGAGVRYEAARWTLIPGTIKGIFLGPYIESPPSRFTVLATATGIALVLVGSLRAGRRGLLLSLLAYVPLHLYLAASLTFATFWNRRFIIPGTPFLLALAALGLETLPANARRAASLLVLLVVGHFTIRLEDTSDRFHWRTDRRPVVRETAKRLASEGRRVFLDLPAAGPVFLWYEPGLAAWADTGSSSFALPAHRAVITSFFARRGVRFDPPDSGVAPLSSFFSPEKR